MGLALKCDETEASRSENTLQNVKNYKITRKCQKKIYLCTNNFYTLLGTVSKLRPFVLKYCRKIPISSIDVVNLEYALQNYNKEVVSNLLLMDLSFGDQFVLQSHPNDIFEIQSKRRTRYVCRALSSGKLFLIKGTALVIKIES